MPEGLKFILVEIACLLVIVTVAFMIGGVVGDVIILVAILAVVVHGVGSMIRELRKPERSDDTTSGG